MSTLLCGAGLSLLLAGCDGPPAATAAPATPVAPGGTVYLDLNVAAKAVGHDEFLKSQLSNANTSLTQQLTDFAGGITQQLEAEKSKLGEEPSAEELERYKQLNLQARQRLQQVQIEARTKAQQFRTGLVQQFLDEVRPLAAAAATARGAVAVQITDAGVLWVDDRASITADVVAALVAKREAEKSAAEAAGGAGAAGSTPAKSE